MLQAHANSPPPGYPNRLCHVTPPSNPPPSNSQVVIIIRASAKSLMLPLIIMRVASRLQFPVTLTSALVILLLVASLCHNVSFFSSLVRPSPRIRPPPPPPGGRRRGQDGSGGGGGDDCGRAANAAAAAPAITTSAAMHAGDRHGINTFCIYTILFVNTCPCRATPAPHDAAPAVESCAPVRVFIQATPSFILSHLQP